MAGVRKFKPTKRSPRNMASSGTSTPNARRSKCAPAKSAMAPMGAKFHGCGATRRMTPKATRAEASQKRGVKGFIVLLLLWLDVGWASGRWRAASGLNTTGPPPAPASSCRCEAEAHDGPALRCRVAEHFLILRVGRVFDL